MSALHFDAATHVYRKAGVVLPHITGILKPVQPDDSYYTEEGRERGIAVHKAVQSGKGWEQDLLPEYVGYLHAWDKFVREHVYVSVLAEVPLAHPSGWAGTPDQYGVMDEEMRVCFEIKTGPHHPSHALQTAAQAELIRVNGNKLPHLRFTLQLRADGRYSIVTHKERSDLATFLSLLNVYRFKQRHNLL